ncbi:MAG: T9SS type A sorting domain-containing protein [Ignavibacteria bacterium]|nr:T9SS type A sorting domain-containing protein [Ignavibacteria bacterium]
MKFSISNFGFTSLKVFDLLGSEVATLINEPKQPGEYEIEFDASKYGLSSGVYLYQLRAGSFTATKKFVYIR